MYHFLTPMLLNEVQKQRRQIEADTKTIDELKAELHSVTQRLQKLEALTQRLEALERRMTVAVGTIQMK